MGARATHQAELFRILPPLTWHAVSLATHTLTPTRTQVISRGYDIKTQTYDTKVVKIAAGVTLDCRVTLFPDLPAIRWDADMLMILGKERFLIDYTQTPITWGCDSSGGGCIFELTGYDHTPSKPQGPRFYINVVFKKTMDGGPDVSAEEMFASTGKAPMTDGGRRRGRERREAWEYPGDSVHTEDDMLHTGDELRRAEDETAHADRRRRAGNTPPPATYVRVGRGKSCVQAGYTPITVDAECETAAVATGHTDTSVSVTRTRAYPRGCFIWASGGLSFNTETASTDSRRDTLCCKGKCARAITTTKPTTTAATSTTAKATTTRQPSAPAPRAVTVLHTAHGQLGDTGQYFFFDAAAWGRVFGGEPPVWSGTTRTVSQSRGGKVIWTGAVIVWYIPQGNGVHGRVDPIPLGDRRQWAAGDTITAPAKAHHVKIGDGIECGDSQIKVLKTGAQFTGQFIFAELKANACPQGTSAVPKDKCVAAAYAAGKAAGRAGSPKAKLQTAAWPHTPPGCFTHAITVQRSVSPHFSTGTGKNDGRFQLVCETNGVAACAELAAGDTECTRFFELNSATEQCRCLDVGATVTGKGCANDVDKNSAVYRNVLFADDFEGDNGVVELAWRGKSDSRDAAPESATVATGAECYGGKGNCLKFARCTTSGDAFSLGSFDCSSAYPCFVRYRYKGPVVQGLSTGFLGDTTWPAIWPSYQGGGNHVTVAVDPKVENWTLVEYTFPKAGKQSSTAVQHASGYVS